MARSIFDTVGLALTLAFAIPVAYAGVSLLLDGRTTWGAVLLGLAVLMVAIEEYVTTPMDVPGKVAGKVLGTAVKDPDADEGPTAGSAARPETEGDEAAPADDGDEVLIPDAEEDRSR